MTSLTNVYTLCTYNFDDPETDEYTLVLVSFSTPPSHEPQTENLTTQGAPNGILTR